MNNQILTFVTQFREEEMVKNLPKMTTRTPQNKLNVWCIYAVNLDILSLYIYCVIYYRGLGGGNARYMALPG
jgi:hypothetical protein